MDAVSSSTTNKSSPPKMQTPIYQTKIHLPHIPGSFTFRKNGKFRLDQKVKKFCILNNSIGCYELQIHLPYINPSHIKYDATQTSIEINTFADSKKFQLSVIHPKGLRLHISENPESQYHYGVLSCKLPIIDFDRNIIFTNKKWFNKQKKKKNMNKKSIKKDISKNAMGNETAANAKIVSNAEKAQTFIKSKKKRTRKPKLSTKEKGYKRKISVKRTRKENMLMLNKKIRANMQPKNNIEFLPPIKKRKLDKIEQFALIDGVMNNIEMKIKERDRIRFEKVDEVKEFLKQRSEKKRVKAERLNRLKDAFMKRKKKSGKYRWRQKGIKKDTKIGKKRVRFAV